MTKEHNHIHLLGNPVENFYILGKKDKSSFGEIYHQISMLCARNQKLAKILKLTTELSSQLHKKHTHTFKQYLEAYSEGLERPINDISFALLLPEVVASFNKWVPNLMGLIPGCSSLFFKTDSNEVIHTRVLDYALSGPFEDHERSILYEFYDLPKIFSHSTSGMPFPSLSATNEHGLSLALHYKHGNYFNLDGDSIFFINQQILQNCKDIRDAIKFLKEQRSISFWGIYLADKNGEVASIDICGNDVYQEKFDLNDHSYLYFNNRPLLKHQEQIELQPFGNSGQCLMRRQSLDNSIKIDVLKSAKNPLLESAKILGSAKASKQKDAQNWNLKVMTPSSIQLCAFNLTNGSSIAIPGKAPKFYEDEYYYFKNIFKKIELIHKEKEKEGHPYITGYRYMALFQSQFDLNKITEAYHSIQMASEYLKGYPDYYIAHFYFIVLQYIYETDKRDLTYLYDDLIALENKLPEYLEDHRKLFLLRVGKLIGHREENLAAFIKNPGLRKYYEHEYKLNSLGIRALKNLIFPRIEIVDIIYSY